MHERMAVFLTTSETSCHGKLRDQSGSYLNRPVCVKARGGGVNTREEQSVKTNVRIIATVFFDERKTTFVGILQGKKNEESI